MIFLFALLHDSMRENDSTTPSTGRARPSSRASCTPRACCRHHDAARAAPARLLRAHERVRLDRPHRRRLLGRRPARPAARLDHSGSRPSCRPSGRTAGRPTGRSRRPGRCSTHGSAVELAPRDDPAPASDGAALPSPLRRHDPGAAAPARGRARRRRSPLADPAAAVDGDAARALPLGLPRRGGGRDRRALPRLGGAAALAAGRAHLPAAGALGRVLFAPRGGSSRPLRRRGRRRGRAGADRRPDAAREHRRQPPPRPLRRRAARAAAALRAQARAALRPGDRHRGRAAAELLRPPRRRRRGGRDRTRARARGGARAGRGRPHLPRGDALHGREARARDRAAAAGGRASERPAAEAGRYARRHGDGRRRRHLRPPRPRRLRQHRRPWRGGLAADGADPLQPLPGASLPEGREARTDWLWQRWHEVDDWIGEQAA